MSEQRNAGWTFERGTSERVDDHGWVISEPTDNAEFVCHDHEFTTGVLPVRKAREDARAHFTQEHPGQANPFSDPA